MSQLSLDSAARAKSDPLTSLAARLPDPQDREWFAGLVAYIHSLPPQDEFVQVAQLFGFLTLIGRELPEQLDEQRQQLRKLLLDAHAEFKKQVQTNASYHDRLAERLNRLPEEIANGVKPAEIAKAMAESFRQQIAATGLAETKSLLSAATNDLRRVTRDLDEAVRPLSERYGSLAGQIERQAANIDSQASKLISAANLLQRKNSELLQDIQNLHWYWFVAAALLFVLLGGILGATWEKHDLGDLVVGLQQQIAQLEQTVRTPPPPAAPAAGKAAKKKVNTQPAR
jgi:chromosome segregation ATPase